MIQITDEMVAAGEDVLGSAGEHVDAAELVRMIYTAMAEKAPRPRGGGKAEPQEPFEATPRTSSRSRRGADA